MIEKKRGNIDCIFGGHRFGGRRYVGDAIHTRTGAKMRVYENKCADCGHIKREVSE